MKNLKMLTYPIVGNSKFSTRNLYIFKTHDIALLSWLEAVIRLDTKEDLFLITIDNHIDLPDESNWDDLIENLAQIKQISNVCEQYNRFKDDFQNIFEGFDVNFILTAFEIGLFEGCLIISPEKGKDDRISKIKVKYPDKNIYLINSLVELYHPKSLGILNDCRDPVKIGIRRIIERSTLILDLDLDYFTYRRDENRFVISEDNFNWLLNNEVIKNLFINEAACITIALEESYCNLSKNDNCEKIFDRLMQFFKELNLIEEEIRYKEIIKQF